MERIQEKSTRNTSPKGSRQGMHSHRRRMQKTGVPRTVGFPHPLKRRALRSVLIAFLTATRSQNTVRLPFAGLFS